MWVVHPCCPMAAGEVEDGARLTEPGLALASCRILRCSLDVQGFRIVLQFFRVVKIQLAIVLRFCLKNTV